MHEPKDIAASSHELNPGDVLAQAFDAIGRGGVSAISPAFEALRAAGVAPSDAEAQPILIEAIFHMLEGLEQNFMDRQIYELILRLDPLTAELAATLLKTANFPEGAGAIADLADGTVLLLGALIAAAGRKEEADAFLVRAEYSRFDSRFRQAVFTLQCRILDDEDAAVDRLVLKVIDCLDHPELWTVLPGILDIYPDLVAAFDRRLKVEVMFMAPVTALRMICLAVGGQPAEALKQIEPIATANSLIPVMQGAVFFIRSLLDPTNPVYDLHDRFCDIPFETLDVHDGSSHLCCSSWLLASVGDLAAEPWQNVWNSEAAQDIRASIHDGSYRHCNKTACPIIGANNLPTKAQVAARSDKWRDIVENGRTVVPQGPHRVNLAYDNTCNLSCPSCRTEKIASDSAKRARFDKLQEDAILPMLRSAKLVFITGAGDPFASKNFRQLMERLGPEDYPELRFQIMTNGMLFNRREWDRFPALHGRVAFLRISLDAATGATHELLRRGARWPVMEENLAFASELRAQGLIDRLDLTFVVQKDNFREMGDAVDLARRYGADSMGFFRLTNWGTFTPEQYADKAVFMSVHPEHGAFLEAMRDSRLRDPIASIGELQAFTPSLR